MLFKPGTQTLKVMEEGIKLVIGNGSKVRFWHDIRMDSVSLREAFPRMFALATIKDGFITDYGDWIGNVWQWKVKLRRDLFG
ncbi:hypothetical protein Dsin_011730 [Dipteronia sinensis]|uniref:Uncharacterized protein n=1 Tax=Dipteronia sinensis TaxID=43782 RepID=A0AAE0AHC5_9ROSI|nr:hypothetical protein Dsin_011730 [Dipteronia sinensis]